MATRRKKADKTSQPEPQPFVVGEESSPLDAPEERPELSEETIESLIALRGHLDQRAPSLLWPLHRSLPSMRQYLSDLESADEAVNRIAVRHALSTAKLAELSRWLLEDAYAFNFVVCDHRAIVPEIHMPMAYAGAGQAQKLAWCLTQSGFEGYVIEQFRDAVQTKDVNPYSHDGVLKLERALQWQNQRYVRGWFKSSVISHGCMTLRGTFDPNETILVLCAKEDKAFEIVRQIGETAMTGRYADLYPDRVPTKKPLKDEIVFGGRTVSSREKTVQGFSPISNEIGGHFSMICTDDIIVRDARGGIIGGGPGGQSIRWMSGMNSLHIITRPFWRIHLGTVNDVEDDDHAWLTKSRRGKRVFTVVVPGERYENNEYPEDVFERGTPTMPDFYPESKIIEALETAVNDIDELDGVEAFRSDVWLAPQPKRTRLFTAEVINDPARCWIGPFEHPRARFKDGEKFKERFLVARHDKATNKVLPFDPWEDLDVIVTINPTWEDGGKLWAVSAIAVDSEQVRYQLETCRGEDGIDGWTVALARMAKYYKPRVIGLQDKAWNDAVQNRFRTNDELRGLARKVRTVSLQAALEESRIRAFVADLYATGKLLLAPKAESGEDFGSTATRREMLRYRSGSDSPWPVLESLAMVDALVKRVSTKQERDEMKKRQRENEAISRASTSELGFPMVV